MLAKAVITSFLLFIAVINNTACSAVKPLERQRQATVSLNRLVAGEYMPFCTAVAVGKHTLLTNKHCFRGAEELGIKIYFNTAWCEYDKIVAFDGVDGVLVHTCQEWPVYYPIYGGVPVQGEKVTHYGHPHGGPLLYREGVYLQGYTDDMGNSYLFDMTVARGDSGGPIFDAKGRLICTIAFQIKFDNDPFNVGGCYPPRFTKEQLKEIK